MRKERRNKYYLGTRRHGRGNIKNGRGAGQRGGRGNAGLKKHKFTWVVKYAPDYFGRKGFVRKKIKVPVINLYEIQQKIEKGEIKDKFEFKGKVLGTGVIAKPIEIKAIAFTKKAKEKLQQIGAKIVEE